MAEDATVAAAATEGRTEAVRSLSERFARRMRIYKYTGATMMALVARLARLIAII
jgi:hypothetical protein